VQVLLVGVAVDRDDLRRPVAQLEAVAELGYLQVHPGIGADIPRTCPA
jgi:hypothetical protein